MKRSITIAMTAFAIAACGGPDPATPTSSPPPQFPPSMQPASPNENHASAPPANDEVTQGAAALDAGDLKVAKSHFDAALKKNPSDADATYYIAVIADKSNDRAAAEKGYRDALKLKPELDAAAVNLGALLIDAQKYDDAIAITRAAITKHPESASLHANLATALAANGDAAGSAKAFNDAVQRAPNDAMILLTYAHWLNAWKQSEAAGDKLRAARALVKDDVGMLAAIGHEMWIAGANKDCVATLDQAIAKKSAAELLTDRALCKASAKDDAGAIADLQSAVTTEPKYAPAHYYLGGRLASAGKLKEAIAEYETFLKLEPNAPNAKVATQRIKLLKDALKKKK